VSEHDGERDDAPAPEEAGDASSAPGDDPPAEAPAPADDAAAGSDPVLDTTSLPDPDLPAEEASGDGDGGDAPLERSSAEGRPLVYVHPDDSDPAAAALARGEGPADRPDTQRLGDDEPGDSELRDAYDCLRIRTPLQEFETYAKARLETLVRLGEGERAGLTSEALELGLEALKQVMGAAPPTREAP